MKARVRFAGVSAFASAVALSTMLLAAPSDGDLAERQKKCTGGDATACFEAGASLENAAPANPAAATAMYRRACELKNAEGCAKSGQAIRACELGVTHHCSDLCDKGNVAACAAGCKQDDPSLCAKSCLRGTEASCGGALASPDVSLLAELCTKGKTQACEMKLCVGGDESKCDGLCKLEVMVACEKASSEIRSRVEERVKRRKAEERLPALMAACERHRARWLQADAAAAAARQSHSPAGESKAEDAMEEAKNALGETRRELQEVTITLTSGMGKRFTAIRDEGRAKCVVKKP